MHLYVKYMEEQKVNSSVNEHNLIDKIEALKQQLDVIWEKLITSEISDGMKLISNMFEKLDAIITEIVSIKNINIAEFFDCMKRLEDAMNMSDYMLIADLVKYEIKQIINVWENELNYKN